MKDSHVVPGGIDVTKPNVARMYDYYLGGKDNYRADREAAGRVLRIAPEASFMAQQNRAFLTRSVRYLARAGIRQFIDVGTGLPTQGNVHEVAHGVDPAARVVYVDNDPVVLVHARALLAGTGEVSIVQEDLRHPQAIIHHPDLVKLIDFDEPCAVLLLAIMHFIKDEDDPYGIVSCFRDAMPPGSYVAISHSTVEAGPERVGLITDVYKGASAPAVLRTREQIARLFDGFDLLEPGLVYTPQWMPESPCQDDPRKAWMLAGVGRKPSPG